jgi:hypothetical protein
LRKRQFYYVSTFILSIMAKYNKISDAVLLDAVSKTKSLRAAMALLGIRQNGGSHTHFSRRLKALGGGPKYHLGQAHMKGKVALNRLPASEILVLREFGYRQKSALLLRALLEIGREQICAKCGQTPDWLGFPLTLDIDHINENWLDDREENLRFLCPNCHSQFSRGLLKLPK